jgi:hypothetical protein
VKCLGSSGVTLTGTIEDGFFGWHDTFEPTKVLALSAPICVVREGEDYFGYPPKPDDRMDGVDKITIYTAADDAAVWAPGTRVRVKGTHLQTHSGSGYYSAPLLMIVESITKL